MRPAVFLDRDGTMIEDVGYLSSLDQVTLFPWTVDSVRALNRADLPVIVVTNQSGVARGMFDEAFVDETHRHLSAILRAGGAHIDAYYHCPHHPTKGTVERYSRTCDCRKPARGMADRAARDHGLDLARSFVVGDTWLDVGLGRAVGARSLLVRTGGGAWWEARPQDGLAADVVVDNLAAATGWILRSLKSEARSLKC